jgi:hypothetical protein
VALPAEQIAELRASAEGGHEEQIARLRAVVRLAEDEIGLHEALLELVRSDPVMSLLERLHDSRELARKLAADPQAQCRDEGITLPEGLTINAVESDDSSGRLSIYLGYGAWNAEVIWDREGGTAARPGLFVRARRSALAERVELSDLLAEY